MDGYVIPETNDRADYEYEKRRQEESDLVDQAFRDIIAGNFDSHAVQDALRLGHRPEYRSLVEQRDLAERAARHAGVA